MTSEFHAKEITDFIITCTTKNISSENLRIRFNEEITLDNVTLSTNQTRRKLRDFLENKSVPCGKGSDESIQYRLSLLLDQSNSTPSSPNSNINYFATTSAKRDILKVPRNKDDMYGGPYSDCVIYPSKQNFQQDCAAFEVAFSQQLFVLHIMFRENALRYLTNHVKAK